MRLDVHVHPGSRSPGVGGNYAGALVVRVRSRALHGAATDEVLVVVAEAFNVHHSAVGLLRGASSRRKVLTIEGDGTALELRRILLLGPTNK